jgi:hypothetical protein
MLCNAMPLRSSSLPRVALSRAGLIVMAVAAGSGGASEKTRWETRWRQDERGKGITTRDRQTDHTGLIDTTDLQYELSRQVSPLVSQCLALDWKWCRLQEVLISRIIEATASRACCMSISFFLPLHNTCTCHHQVELASELDTHDRAGTNCSFGITKHPE